MSRARSKVLWAACQWAAPVVLPGPPARAPFKGPQALVRCLSSQNGPRWQAAQLRRPGAVSDLGTWCPQPLGRVLALSSSNLTFVINLDRNQRSLLPVRLGVTTTKPLISTTATTQPRVASSPSCTKEEPVLLIIVAASVYQIWHNALTQIYADHFPPSYNLTQEAAIGFSSVDSWLNSLRPTFFVDP